MRDNWFITKTRVMHWKRIERVNIHLFTKERIRRSFLNFLSSSEDFEVRQAAAILKLSLKKRGSLTATSTRCSVSGRSRAVIRRLELGRMGSMNLARDGFVHGFGRY